MLPLVIIILIGLFIADYSMSFAESCKTQRDSYSSYMNIPALDDKGKGTFVRLEVEAINGKGRLLTNIDKIIFWADTQESIQTAKKFAEEFSGIDTSRLDIIYTLSNDNNQTGLVGGPSAGAATTIATIFALRNEEINPKIMITGTINRDGTIGSVGGILEKAVGAKKAGAVLFLVPAGQKMEKETKPVKSCERGDFFEYCRIKYEDFFINISQEAGIEIKEVSGIRDALDYF